jgi:hypothetical protein
MQQQTGSSNLERIFRVAAIPSATQMREIVDGVPTDPLRRLLPQTFEQMRWVGWTARFVTEVGDEKYSPVVLDGSESFHSTQISCSPWLHQRQAKGETHYAHLVVSARVTRAGSPAILPLEAEEVGNSDAEQAPQECELTAAKRLVRRLRAEHRQLAMWRVGDDLYGHEPLVGELHDLRLHYVLVAKPSSQPALFAAVEECEQRGACGHGTWTEGRGPRRRTFTYRTAAHRALTPTGAVRVNFLEVWEQRPTGPVGYHNSWITACVVTPETGATIAGSGRSRWKIENEQFKGHKNPGYELEPNDGHGQQTLSMVFDLLTLLAFLAHKLFEFGHRLYQPCREGESRRGLWTLFRSAF